MSDSPKGMTSECSFMKLPKCHLQNINSRLDLQICQACIAGRSERHLFEIKEELTHISQQIAQRR